MPGGLVEYLRLTPEQRKADYRARVEKAARDHPEDPAAELAYLKLLAEEGHEGKAGEAKGFVAMRPAAAMLVEAGHALLEGKQYGPARLVAGGSGKRPLAIATFPCVGRKDGLALLDRLPDPSEAAIFS